MITRLKSLDWLRGLMALSILLYHLRDRSDCDTVLGRLGVYGVSIFFILSGLSMAIAYDRFLKDLRSAGAFFIRRIFRIWPLLWLAVVLVAVPAYIRGNPISAVKIGLNLTTLFGFVAPTHYVNTGAWSIGNEMVYYALTPLLIAGYHYRKWLGNSVTLAATLIGIIFAFRLLHPDLSLAGQWAVYINPFNNLYLYCMGLAIYYTFRDSNVSRRWYIGLLLGAVTAFVFYPATGDSIHIVTGIPRVAFSLISVALVLAFWKFPLSLPDAIGDNFEKLGIATYGVYLLHPIVIYWTGKGLRYIGVYEQHLFVLLVLGITIPLALFIFRVFESPMIKLGKRITQARPAIAASAKAKEDNLLPQ